MKFVIFYLISFFGQTHDCLWWWDNDPPSAVLNVKAAQFHLCITGPHGIPTPCCKDVFDVDDDEDVDLADFAEFTVCVTNISENEIQNSDRTQEIFQGPDHDSY